MEQVIDCISIHCVKTRDFPGLSCGVSLRNAGEKRLDPTTEQRESSRVEHRSERPAREWVEDRTTIGMEGES